MRRCLLIIMLLLLAGCNLQAPDAEPTLPPTPNIPRIQFLSPSAGDRILAGFDLTFDILAEDNAPGAGVAKIDLLLDGEVFREVMPENGEPVPVFRAETNWFADGVGLHAFSAIAYRRDGTPSDEVFLTLEVVTQ